MCLSFHPSSYTLSWEREFLPHALAAKIQGYLFINRESEEERTLSSSQRREDDGNAMY